MAKTRKGGIHAANQAKAKARWKQVSKDLSTKGKLSAAELAKHISSDTASLMSDLLDSRSADEVTRSIADFKKSLVSRTDKLNNLQTKANINLAQALAAVGDDQVKRSEIQDRFQTEVFDRLEALRDKIGTRRESLEDRLEKLQETVVDEFESQAAKLSETYEEHFQNTRKLRSRELKKERAERLAEAKKNSSPEAKLAAQIEDMRKEQAMLSRSLIRRYAIDPMIAGAKSRIQDKWNNFQRKTGISAVRNFMEKERRRRDDLDELQFKIAQTEVERQGHLLSQPLKSAIAGGTSLEEQDQSRMARREVSALEKIADSLRSHKKAAKEDEETSGLLTKLALGIPLLAAAIPAAIARLGSTLSGVLGKAGSFAKNAVATAAESAANGAKALFNGAKSLVTNPVGTFKSWVTAGKNAAEDAMADLFPKASKAWSSVISALRAAPGNALELTNKAGKNVFQFLTAGPSKPGFLKLVRGLVAKANPATVLTGLRRLITAGVTGVALGVLVDMLVDTVASSVGLSPATASLVKMILNAAIALIVGGAGGLAIYLVIEAAIYAYEQFEKFPDKASVLDRLKGVAVAAGKEIASDAKAAVRTAADVTATATGVASHAIGKAVAAANGEYPDMVANVSSLASSAGTAMSEASDYVIGGAKSAFKTVKSALGKLFRPTGPDIDVEHLHPAMQHRLLALAQEYEAMYGEPLDLNSAFRSYTKQAELYRQDPKRAARPGTSLHEVGLAADFKPSQVDKLKSSGLLAKYGLEGIRGTNERQHVQIKGGSRMAQANGLTSGDYVKNSLSSVSADAPETGGAGYNTSNVKASITPLSVTPTAASTPSLAPSMFPTAGSGGAGLGPISIDTVPTFSYQDPSLFALNLGAIGG